MNFFWGGTLFNPEHKAILNISNLEAVKGTVFLTKRLSGHNERQTVFNGNRLNPEHSN